MKSLKVIVFCLFLILCGNLIMSPNVDAAVMNDYCIQPPFIAQSVPPLVMFSTGREHKLYYEAYNDAADLDEDGRLETTYKHSVTYYGYFDPDVCYTYDNTGTANFEPAGAATSKFCAASQWSGNILNWLTMSRMDVLRKVLYGGHRSTDSTTNVLERVNIPHDAHSWGKEVTGRLCYNATATLPYTNMCMTSIDCESGYTCTDKSVNLIGIGPSDAPIISTTTTAPWDQVGKILVARYNHTNSSAGTDHADLLNSYQPGSLQSGYPKTITNFDSTETNGKDDNGNYLNIFAVTEFDATGSTGNWEFVVDGDDGVELEIDGAVVASYYGAHGSCYAYNKKPKADNTGICSATQRATITLGAGYHRLIARHSDVTGQEGVRVWYKLPDSTTATEWTIVGSTLTLRAPTVTTGNLPSIKTTDFITSGTPSVGTFVIGTAKQHLFCSTSLNLNTAPLLRRLLNRSERVWDWASKERPVCDTSMADGTTVSPEDFEVRVQVCNDSDPRTNYFNNYCRNYGTAASPEWKPSGLLQKFGERLGGKVCSRALAKTCNSDSQCDLATEGICIDRATMFFGLMTDTYTKNMSGGMLRKNFSGIEDETQINGYFQSSESTRGNLVLTFDRLHTVGYDYSSNSYPNTSDGGNCDWITTRSLQEGECRNWGNPIAELLYEGVRYIAGKGEPTAAFTVTATADAGISLTKPDWGYKTGSTTYQPYEIFPSCAKPFILLLSDINTSYDGDQLPGTSFASVSEDTRTPHLGIGDVSDGRSFLNSLMDTIGTDEGITGHNWFIGDNGVAADKNFMCSSKQVSDFSLASGICPEEPTKKGSYYSAAVAYYAHSYLFSKAAKPNINTFVVALSSPVADIKVKVGGKYVTLVPIGKSVSGSSSVKASCYDKCTVTIDADGAHITNCAADAFCPSNQIVDFYVDEVTYDSSNSVTHARFRINFEDVEQGADHDMDAIVLYEITPVDTDKVEVRLKSEYAAGSIDQVMGFVISGTTEDDAYLAVRDADAVTDGDTPSTVAGMLLEWHKTFTVSSIASAPNFLKSPLWYAAKWGGFQDINGNDKPDTAAEWDKDGDSEPDNYFLVVNPLMLETQLRKALEAILARVASGTAASILNNSEGSGANLVQAVFYPKKQFDDNTEVSWIGEMQNLWYFLDPNLQKTSIREDTDHSNTMHLKDDHVVQYYFDSSQNQTLVKRFLDADGDGAADNAASPLDTVTPDDVNSLWQAGTILWERDLTTSPRTIYTSYNSTSGSSMQKFSNLSVDGYFNTWPNVWNILQIPAGTDAEREAEATKIINYIHGIDQSGYRNRKVSILGCGLSTCLREWKLGDIVSSTPKLVSNVKLNNYNLTPPTGYNDTTYDSFTKSTTYQNRGMVLVGGNDGLLHAFKLGILKEISDPYAKAKIVNTDGSTATSSSNLGQEEWAFIPKQALPYLKYLADPEYSHLFYVDRTSTIIDASISKPTGCDSALDYSDCAKSASTWRTVLVGGMGFGGAAKPTTSTCTAPADCVKTPITGSGYSSYFALDVTDPANPLYMWDFYGDTGSPGTLGFSTTGPAIVRISAKVKDVGGNDTANPDHSKNGKWFAVFASGPTGPIDTSLHQFKGESDQQLRIFVVDLATGVLLRTITTDFAGNALPSNAFAGSLATSVIDADRNNASSLGYYSDDAVYIGYVQKDTTTNTWTKGGVLRLQTKESRNPNDWVVSTLINDVGPVTTAVTKLQDRRNYNLWVYFGTGRFFYKQDDFSTTRQQLYGVKEPCYSTANRTMQTAVGGGTYNDLDKNCTDAATGTLTDQTGDATTSPSATIAGSSAGWFVTLDPKDSVSLTERVITDPIASSSGAVFFTTFKPSADICKFGGDSLVWALRYDTGGVPPSAAMQGRALMQVSTGAFAEISLKDAFNNPTNKGYDGRRLAAAISGVPPTAQGLSLLTNPRPVKRLLHMQER